MAGTAAGDTVGLVTAGAAMPDNLAVLTDRDGLASEGTLRLFGPDRITIALAVDGARHSFSCLVGDRVSVTVTATSTEVEAEILSTSLLGGIEVCQLRVLEHLKGPPLGVLGERRSAPRIRPRTPIWATVTSHTDGDAAVTVERTVTAMSGDLSAGAAGLELSRADYHSLGSVGQALVTFRLPTTGEQLRLLAERKNTRMATTDRIWMGLGWVSGDDNAAPVATISAYLASS